MVVYRYYFKNLCSCIYYQLYENGVFSYLGVERRCPEHDDPMGEVSYNNWHENMMRHSDTQNFFMANLTSQLFDANESGALFLKNGIEINYNWTGLGANRILTITVTGFNLTNQQKNTIQNLCNTKFGVGKVIIG